jgi:hypothetical protein
MQKKVILSGLIVAIFALMACSAFAFDFNVAITPDTSVIKINETATFEITISHNSRSIESFEIYSPDVQWDVRTYPFGVVKVSPSEDGKVSLAVAPLYVAPGYYYVPIHVRPIGRDMLSKTMLVIGVLPLNAIPGEYVPSLRVAPEMKSQIDPREEVLVNVTLENQNRREVGDVTIKLRSNVINKDYETTLTAFEKKNLEFKILLDPATKPQSDVLQINAFATAGGEPYRFEAEPLAYEILAYGEITETTDVQKSFLKRTKTITFVNTGNDAMLKEFLEKKTFFKSLFSSFSADYTKKTTLDDLTYYSWDIRLGTGEQTTLTITTNYALPLLIALAIVALFFLYYTFRSPLIIIKSATVITAREGGMSEFKILLNLKNRSMRTLKNVSVLDKLPRIAEVVKDFELGSTKPEKILRADKTGTMLKWKFEQIDPREERMITYRIASKLAVIGGVRLPVAVGKFETSPGRERTTSSNCPTVGLI